MSADEIEMTIEIVCTDLPGNGSNDLQLGLQREDAITELRPAAAKRIVFKPRLRALRNEDGSVNFLGPFAQGPKAERIVYLNWVAKNGEMIATQVGRIKLHLNHIKWTQAAKSAKVGKPIRVTLALTTPKGGPLLASVRPDLAKWEFP